MLFSEVANRLNLNVVESTISGENYVSINYFVENPTMYENVLYIPSNALEEKDVNYSFLFINHMPEGEFKKYAFIKTEKDPIHLFSQIQNLFITNYNVSNYLVKLATIGSSENTLENLMKIAVNIANNPIILCNTSYELIYANNNNLVYSDSFWDTHIKLGTTTSQTVTFFENSNITKKVRTQNEPVLWQYPDKNTHKILTQRIMGEKGVIAYVSFLLINEDNIKQSMDILKQLSTMLPNLLIDTSKRINTKNQLKKLFLNHLLEDAPLKNIDLNFHMENIHFHPKKNYRLILISSDKNAPIYNMDYYLNIVMNSHIIGTTYNGKILLMITYEHEFHEIILSIRKLYENTNFRYLISPEYKDILHTHRIMHVLNGDYYENAEVNYIEDYLMIKHVPALDLYNSTYEALEKSPNGMELIKTLAVFIENNMNITDCAKALFIHRNTTMYRLERIREEGNIDLEHYLQLMNFYIYYCMKNNLL